MDGYVLAIEIRRKKYQIKQHIDLFLLGHSILELRGVEWFSSLCP